MTKGWRRTWIKLFVTGWLHGSIRWELEADERGAWADLIVLAGECGREGRIADNSDKPYPRSFIANQLNIPQELLDRTIAKCRAAGRLDDNDEIIIITNWAVYQSEYQRQKPYRQGKPTEAGKTPLSRKDLLALKQERKRLGLCENCGEEGHTKYACPHSKYQHLTGDKRKKT